MIPPPERDGSRGAGNAGLAQYARAVQEALTIGANMSFVVHMPMYREPGIDGEVETLSSINPVSDIPPASKEIDIYTTWDSWHNIRSVCNYNLRLFLGEQRPTLHNWPLLIYCSFEDAQGDA